MNRAFLYACGMLYLGYGLWVLLSPTTSLAYLEIGHGGLNVALGLFLLWAAGDRTWFRQGLWLVFLVNIGYFGGRVVALVTDGMPTGIVPAVMLLEAVLFVCAFLLARQANLTSGTNARLGSEYL